jgi:hypothetical protein
MDFIGIGEDNLVEIDQLQDATDDSNVTDATGNVIVKNTAGGTVISAQTMSYVSGTDAKYRAILDAADTVSLTEGTLYYVDVTLASSGRDLFRRLKLKAAYHGKN